MPLSPILPKWVNSVSSQTDGSVFPSIGGSFLVSVKVDCGVMGIRLLFLMVLIVGSGCDVIVVLSAGVC